MAIDADYKTALEDLIKVQRQLRDDGIEAALEKSKRGGHLWIFFERPVMAREARIYIYHVAGRLAVQVKGAGLSDGIEIFPKQDELRPEEFGNAIRAPLGVHWGARESRGWRYWYYGADYTLEDQLAYLAAPPEGPGAALAADDRGQGDSPGICAAGAKDGDSQVFRVEAR